MAQQYEPSESGNWNVADKWSESMVFQPLFECSNYLKVADSGCVDLEEDLTFDNDSKIQFKIKGLEWARRTLEQGIKQSLFAIKNDSDKDVVKVYLTDVKKLKELIPLIKKRKHNGDKNVIVLDEKVFNFVYEMVDKIFTEITEPLNRSDLIFMDRKHFNPKEFKDKIKQRLEEEG